MIQSEYFDKARDFFTSSKVVKFCYLMAFTVLITTIISSQNFFFQSIIENAQIKAQQVLQEAGEKANQLMEEQT